MTETRLTLPVEKLGPLTRILGCVNCEWRSSINCPFFDGSHTATPKHGICEKRKNWVFSMLPGYKETPTIDKVMLDVSKALQSYRERAEFSEIRRLERAIGKAEEQHDYVEVEALEGRLEKRKREFLAVSQLVSNLRDRQVDRETPKKIDVKQEIRMTPELFGEALKAANKARIIDAEVVKDEN